MKAISPWRTCTAVVGLSPSGVSPLIAPATAVAATMKLPVAAPRWWKRIVARTSSGKIGYG